MYRILTAIFIALFLAGCGSMATAPNVVYKVEKQIVKLDKKHFVIPEEVTPPASRAEMKKMTKDEVIVTLMKHVALLRGDRKILVEQIQDIQKANDGMTDIIEKENLRVKP